MSQAKIRAILELAYPKNEGAGEPARLVSPD